MKYVPWLLVALLCACAPQWEKPGATKEDFETAKSGCEYHAAEHYPPSLHQTLREGAYTTPNRAACFGSPVLADCLRSETIIVPPTFETADANEKPRQQFIERCLREQGWRAVD
jgi:hypothetical protein